MSQIYHTAIWHNLNHALLPNSISNHLPKIHPPPLAVIGYCLARLDFPGEEGRDREGAPDDFAAGRPCGRVDEPDGFAVGRPCGPVDGLDVFTAGRPCGRVDGLAVFTAGRPCGLDAEVCFGRSLFGRLL